MLTTNAPPATVALGLPGNDILCVKRGLALNTINLRTRYIVAELDKATMENIQRKMQRLGFTTTPWYHYGAVETLCLGAVLGNAALDFAFLDFFDPLNAVRAYWLRQQVMPQLRPGSQLAITVNRCARRAHFPLHLRDHRRTLPTLAAAKRSLAAVGEYTTATLLIVATIMHTLYQCVLSVADFIEYSNGSTAHMLSVRFVVDAMLHDKLQQHTLLDRLIDSRTNFAPFLIGK